MRAQPVLLTTLACLLISAGPPVSDVRVVKVTDGDSLWVLTADGGREEIRLAEIDCPERDQPYGDDAKRELSELVSRKYVRLEPLGSDKYERTLARVRIGGVDVSGELLKRGACWVYPKYRRDQSLMALESEARDAKRGLWALPETQQVPPWKWKHRGPPPRSSDFTCGSKTRCSQMSSCEEARFYLERCGATQIDGDRNGVPCEAICR